jgi:hypothetical protein
MSGHVDILRAVMVKWQEANGDEAFSVAFIKRDWASLRVVGARSFVWSDLVISLLRLLPVKEMERVCASYNLTESAMTSRSWCGNSWRDKDSIEYRGAMAKCGRRIWTGVRAMLLRGSAARDVVETAAGMWYGSVLGAKWLRDEEFWSLVRGLRLRGGRIVQHWYGVWQWGKRRKMFLKLAEAV